MLCLVWVLAAQSVQADGGVLRLRSPEGPVVLSVFAAPALLRAGWVEVAVLVQERVSLAPRSDGEVRITFQHQGEVMTQMARAGHNRFLHTARFSIPHAGAWELAVEAEGPGYQARAALPLEVAEAGSRLRDHALALAFPGGGVLLYGIHQRLRGKQSRARRPRRRVAAQG